MEFNNIKIEWLGHAGFLIDNGKKIIAIDVFEPKKKVKKADLILVSHDHFDHLSLKDIESLKKPGTKIIGSKNLKQKIGNAIALKEGETTNFGGIKVKAVPAYNTNKFREPGKVFHPKGLGVGFLIQIENTVFYHAGDTDFIPEMKELTGKVDVAFLPVSGTYVMTPSEAVSAAKTIKPKIVIPMHFGSIVGSIKDAEEFAKKFSGKTVIPTI